MSRTNTDAKAARPWQDTTNGCPEVGGVVVLFSTMTGDRNPLHYDEVLAAGTPFGGLIVQGGVTSGLLNAIVAEDLPGPGTVFLGVEWRFVKAVAVGETIVGRVTITAVRDDKPICELETTVRNAAGELSIMWPPSTPIREAIRPDLWIRSMSSAVRACASSGRLRINRSITSNCLRASCSAIWVF